MKTYLHSSTSAHAAFLSHSRMKGVTALLLSDRVKKYLVTFFIIGIGMLLSMYAEAARSVSSISVGSQTGTLTYGTAASATYTITVTTPGTGSINSFSLGVTGLPSGVSGAFSPGAQSGNQATFTWTLTLTTTTAAVPVTAATFTVNTTDNATTGTGSLTIGKATLTVTATGPAKTYGTALTTLTGATTNFSLSGLVSGDAVTSVTLTPDANGTSTTRTAGLSYSVTPSAAAGTNLSRYNISYVALNGTIGTKALTVTGAAASNKEYDRTNAATISGSLSGIINSDVVTLNGTGTFASVNVGTGIAVTSTSTLSGAGAANYSLTQPTGLTANITAKALTVTGATASNKVYDRSTAATITGASLTGIISPDVVTVSGGGTFADFNVANGKAVTAALTLGGANAGNYSLTQPTGLTANITPAGLTVTGVTGVNKVYDRTTAATLNTGSATLSGIVSGDAGNVTLSSGSATGTFASVNVANGVSITTSGFSISGSAAGNYTLTQPTTSANITPAPLTVTGVTASNKVYNRTTGATLNTGSAALSGVISGDESNVTLNSGSATGTFASFNVANGIAVSTSGFSISGSAAGNYSLTQPATSANITPATLTVTGVTAGIKIYDGTTAATLNTGSAVLSGVISGDGANVTLSSAGATGTFADANVANGIAVSTSGFSISGSASGNYTLTQPATSANITAKGLTVTGLTGNNKVYDRTTSATFSGTAALSGVIPSDLANVSLSGSPSATFATASVANGKTITVSGYSLSGSASGNYSLTQPSLTGNITAKALTTANAVANNKEYDRNTTAVITGTSLVGVISPDVVTVSGGGTFADRNVGTGKAVTASLSLGGADAGNYTLTQPSGLTANITAKALTISTAAASNKVYDGNNSAAITGSLSGIIAPDLVTLSGSGTFATKSVGTAIAVSSTSTLGGADAGNYILTQPTGLTANITAKNLTVTGASASNKVYDRTTAAAITGATLVGVVAPDDVTLSGGGNFATATVGNGKSVTASLSLSGADAGNYSLTQPTGLTANITPLGLTTTGATASNKVFDGTTAATITGTTLVGVIAPDAVTVSGGGTFADKNVGTGKAVTAALSLGGADAGNYTLTQPSGLTATITAKALTISTAAASNKVYDGNTSATITGSLSGIIAPDVVTLSGSGTFATKSVGTGIAVTSTSTLGGADAGNYSLTQPTGLTANITAKALTVTGATASNKVYDGNTSVTIAGATLVGVIATDVVTVSGGGSFANSNVGTGKPVTAALTLGGTDAGNYTLTQPTGLIADITAASLTITATAQSKTYGSTVPTGAGSALFTATGLQNGETVGSVTIAIANSGALAAATVANSPYTITPSAATGGTFIASNYSISYVTGLLTVNTKTLTLTGPAASNKAYDGNTSANITGTIAGTVNGDIITLNGTGSGTFATQNVGTGIAVVSACTISGTNATSYTLTQPTGLTANITAVTINITATSQSKTYGSTVATGAGSTLFTASGLVNSETIGSVTIAIANNGALATATVSGSPYTITPSEAAGGTFNAANYIITYSTGLLTVNPATLTISGASANNKSYDGTTAATITGTLSGVINGDVIVLNGTGTFASKNVGTSIAVTSTSTLSGVNAGSYTLTQPTGLTANIIGAVLTITASNQSKTYGATVTTGAGSTLFTASGLQSGETIGSVTIAIANGGAAATATVANAPYLITPSAATGGTFIPANYSIVYNTALLTVNPKTVTVTGASTSDKVYDGTNAATISGTLSGIINGDVITLVGTGTFAQANVGNNISVSANCTLTGVNASSYTLIQPSTSNAKITAAPLTVAATAQSKTYGSTVPTGAGSTLFTATGLQNGETIGSVTIAIANSGASATATVANSPYTITASLATGGTFNSSNYSISYSTGLLTVNPKTLTLNGAAASNKSYDGTTAAAITGTLSGTVNGDVLTLNGTGTFASANVGTAIAVTSACTISGTNATSYTLIQPTGLAADITGVTLTITANNQSKTYGSTVAAGAGSTLFTATGLRNGETIGSVSIFISNNGDAATATVSGSPYTITPSAATGGTFNASNYSIVYNTGSLTVTPKTLTVTGAAANNKVYDGTNAAVIVGALNGAVNGDIITFNGTGTFASVNVANGIVVTSASTLSGVNAGSYTLTQPTGLTANITRADLIITANSQSKTYGSTVTTGAGSIQFTATGLQAGQTVGSVTIAIANNGALATATVANSPYTITPSAATGGTFNAANYTIIYSTGVLTVNPKSLTIASASANNKVYDGTTVANITGSLSGIVNSDVITLNGTGTFVSPYAGANIPVTSTSTISGANSTSYSLTQPSGLSASITGSVVTINGLTGNNKVYDRTTTATISGTPVLNGVVAADAANVTLSGTPSATFATATVGNGKSITVSGYTLAGSAAGNYILTQPTGLTGNITQLALTTAGATASNKVFDGTTAAIITGTTLVGVISPDAVTISGGGTFADKSVGTGKAVTASLSLSGADAGNYSLNQPAGLSADITKKALTISGAAASNKVYDRTNTATLTGSLNGIISPDAVTLSGTGTFASVIVGTGISVTSTSTLGGADAGNYSLTQPTGLTANITAKALTVTGATASNKVYDGNTSATITGAALIGVIAPDAVTVSGGGAFANANVGTGKSVTAALVLGGADAGNYSLTQPTGLTANITAATLTYTANTASRVYGAANPAFSGTVTGFVNGETQGTATTGTLTFTTTASVTSAVGNYPINGSGLTATNGNYTFVQAAGNATALTITQKSLTVTASNRTKCFGDTAIFAGTEFTSSGLVNSDAVSSVTLTSSGAVTSATVGGSPYSIVPSAATGSGLGNYTISYTNGSLTIIALPTATISGSTVICSGGSATITFTGTANTTVTYNINGGSNLTVNLGAGGSATVGTGTITSTRVYNLVNIVYNTAPACTQSLSGSATVTVNGIPTATISGTTQVCKNSASPNITFTGANGTAPYTFTYKINGGLNQTVTTSSGNSVTVAASTSAAGTFIYSLVSVQDASSTACSQAQSGSATITVNDLPAVSLTPAAASLCIGSGTSLTATNSLGTVDQTFSGSSGTVNVAIADNSNAAYTYPTISLTDNNGVALSSTDVVQVTLNINHGSIQDLDIFLVDPSGTRAMLLSADNGGNGNNYTNTVLRTDAATAITGGSAPFTGTYRTQGNITTAPDRTGAAGGLTYNSVVPANALNGASVNGSWSLRVFDDASNVTGTLVNWSLSIIRPSNYSSAFSGPATIGTVSYSGTNNATATATITPPAAVNTYTVTTTDGLGCTATATTSVTVNTLPTDITPGGTTTICSGSSANITIANSQTGINYQLRNNTGNINVGAAVAGTGGTINLSTGNINATTTYNVLATDATTGCTRQMTGTVTITVNALPVDKTVSGTAAICAGASATISVASSATGVNYQLRNDANNSNVGSPVAGTGGTITLPTGSLSSTTTFNVLAITVATGCSVQMTTTITVTVNPVPSATATNSNQTICSGAAFTTMTLATSNSVAGTTFAWTRNNTSAVTGIATSGSGNITGTALTNTTTAPVTVTFTITPTGPTPTFCAGTPITATIFVNPQPADNAGADRTICNGVSTVLGAASAAGNSYAWSPASSLSNSTVSNPTATPSVTTTYTLTETITATGCSSTNTVIATVNAVPVATATNSSQTICSATAFTTMTLATSNAVSGTTFAWTRDNTSAVTGIASSGSGNITGATLTNTTTADVTVTFTITPTGPAPTFCVGSPITATIVVKPKPVGSATSQTICSGTATSIALSSTVSGSTFSWTRATQSGTVTGGLNCASSCGTTIAQTLTSTVGGVERYTVTTTANGCVANTFTVTATVQVPPTITSQPANAATCLYSPVTLSVVATGSSPLTYQWRRIGVNISGATSSSYGISSVDFPDTGSYTVLVSNGCSLGISSNPATVAITTSASIPYAEDFESITVANQMPNCLTSTNLGTKTFTKINAAMAHRGTKYGSWGSAANDWFFTPALYLTAGTPYNFSYWYRTDNTGASTSMSAAVGTAANAASMNTAVGPTYSGGALGTINEYHKYVATFTPPATGIYYFGSKVTTNNGTMADKVVIDDITVLVECTGTPNAGTASASANPICTGSSATLGISGFTSNFASISYQWQSSPAAANTWTNISGATDTLLTVAPTISTDYRARITCNYSGQSANSNVVALVVNSPTVGGSVGTDSTFCQSGTGTLTLSGYNGSVTKWQSSTSSNFSSFVTDIANTTNTLNYTNVTTTTYYRAVVTNGACSSANSLAATIRISPPTQGGTATVAPPVICEGSTTTAVLSNSVGNIIQWEQSPDASSWGNVVGGSGANTTTYLTAPLYSKTFYRAMVKSGACNSNYSTVDSVSINLNSNINNTTANASQTVCYSYSLDTIVYALSGATTGASVTGLPSGVTGIYSAGTFTISGTPAAAGTYHYTVSTTGSSCTNNIATGTIQVNACDATLTLKAYVQGYYMGAGKMSPLLHLLGNPSRNDVDTVSVYLLKKGQGTSEAAPSKGVLKKDGTLIATFGASVINNYYYIVVKPRNGVETWSADSVQITITYSYDFTTAANKAYGNNLLSLGDGNFAIYNGDINNDGQVNADDMQAVKEATASFSVGVYDNKDINGDASIDVCDLRLMRNYIQSATGIQKP